MEANRAKSMLNLGGALNPKTESVNQLNSPLPLQFWGSKYSTKFLGFNFALLVKNLFWNEKKFRKSNSMDLCQTDLRQNKSQIYN